MKPRQWQPPMRAEDRLLGVMRMEQERMAGQDGGIASLLEEAARVLRAVAAATDHAYNLYGMRDWLPDELDGSALMLRARKP